MNATRYFKDKVVWITGASSGLGRALAIECARLGAKLIVSSRRAPLLEQLKKEMSGVNGEIAIVPFDLMEIEKLPLAVRQAKSAFGRIDIFISNAGLSIRSLTKDLKFDVIDRVVKVNFLGAARLALHVIREMIERQAGHVVVVSSPAGSFGTPYRSAYCAAKHALVGFFESFAAESKRDNIDVSIIVPGWIRTEMPRNALEGDGTVHGVLDPGHAKAKGPEHYVGKITNAIAKKKPEYHVATDWKIKMGFFLKRFFPSLLRASMRKVKVT